jgi:hypothetical protein
MDFPVDPGPQPTTSPYTRPGSRTAHGIPRRARRIVTLAILATSIVALASGVTWGLTHTQEIRDQVRVWTYTPGTAVDSYMDRATMTDRGRHLLLASQPRIQSADTFDGACSSDSDGVGVLGCYVGGSQTIVLIEVSNPELDGIEDVVAAHEMLHAAWDRMGHEERAALTPLLEGEAAARTADPAFAERMAAYAALPPADFINELHSIIGTEQAIISPALEQHYALFFTDRRQLVDLHLRSHAVFVEVENRSVALVAELTALRDGIAADYASYGSGYDTLSADIAAFNVQAGSGTMTVSAYDRDRGSLARRQAALDALYESIEARTATFDSKELELDAINVHVEDLNTSLNITPRAAPVE